MVIVSPLNKVGLFPFQIGLYTWLINGGDPNHLRILGYSSKCSIFLIFTPKLGDFQVDEHMFQMGWFNHQLGRVITQITHEWFFAVPNQIYPKFWHPSLSRIMS